MKKVVIASAIRTPIGSFGGVLKDFSAPQLGALAIKAAIEKAGIDQGLIDEVFMGCVLQANLGQAPARQASMLAGLPDKVICSTINKVCASGMKAVALAAQSIMLGDAEIIVAGGMESMSNVPYYAAAQRWGNKFGNVSLVDGLAKDGLTDVYKDYPMGNAAELCADTCGISRDQQDEYAIESYKRSQAATNNNWFQNEIVPVTVPQKKGNPITIDKDEEPFNVKFEKISELKPAFTKNGTVTAANASTINDGAAALVLMSEEKAASLDIKPLAIILSFADAEQAPEWFTTSPSLAIPKTLDKAGLSLHNVDYFEINEAFSVVSLANMQKLNLDPAKVNVFGGAVSLGHPLGCSGARILVTLLNVLKQKGGHIGVAGICNGGGGASAMVLQAL